MSSSSEARLLLIETSGRVGQVALAWRDVLCAERRLEEARRHARDLAPAVKEMLRAQGWRPGEIAAVLVSRGPGSYTGLRVGIMSAKAFAYATGCQLLGIETFAAIALQATGVPTIEVIADAQQEKVYHQRFALQQGKELPQAETDLRIIPVSEWSTQLTPGAAVSGPGLLRHADHLPSHVRLIERDLWEPQPGSLLRLGLERLARGDHDSVFGLEPLYLRPSSAEEKWNALGKP